MCYILARAPRRSEPATPSRAQPTSPNVTNLYYDNRPQFANNPDFTVILPEENVIDNPPDYSNFSPPSYNEAVQNVH